MFYLQKAAEMTKEAAHGSQFGTATGEPPRASAPLSIELQFSQRLLNSLKLPVFVLLVSACLFKRKQSIVR